MTNMYKTIRKLAVVTVLASTALHSNAQTDAAQLIKAGQADANSLMNGYMGPLMKSIGTGLNAGWFQTAKPLGMGGFSLTMCANATMAPTADQTYDVNALGMQNVKLHPGESSTAPTIFGEAKDGPKVDLHGNSPFTGQDTVFNSMTLPQGLGYNYFAVPTAQLAVGVGFGTEVAVRFVPTVGVGSAGIGLFGFAVKHDFKQWIPVIAEMPFDLSGMFGYTSMNGNIKFTGNDAIQPESDPNTYNPYPGYKYDDQKIELNSKAWTFNILLSKKLSIFTPYLGVGYQTSKTDLDLKGTYPVTVPNDAASASDPTNPSFMKPAVVSHIVDPFKISASESGLRTTLGFRIKLAVLTLHADYTFANYNVASVGVGLNLQSIAPFAL